MKVSRLVTRTMGLLCLMSLIHGSYTFATENDKFSEIDRDKKTEKSQLYLREYAISRINFRIGKKKSRRIAEIIEKKVEKERKSYIYSKWFAYLTVIYNMDREKSEKMAEICEKECECKKSYDYACEYSMYLISGKYKESIARETAAKKNTPCAKRNQKKGVSNSAKNLMNQ